MKVITGNRLSDGAVVYLSGNDQWATRLTDAAFFDKADANSVLGAVQIREAEIAEAYLIEVGDGGVLAGREALRETIRKTGPTVRSDLGRKQEFKQ